MSISLSKVAPILGFALAVAGCLADGAPDDAKGSIGPVASTAGATVDERASTNERAEEAFHLVARVFRSNGNAVEFYEPRPGRIAISEVGPAGNDFLDHPVRHMSPEEVFRTIAPGQEMPSALRAAVERAALPLSLPPRQASEEPSVAGTQVGAPSPPSGAGSSHGLHPETSGACDQSRFTSTQCNVCPLYYWANDTCIGDQWNWQECLVPWSNGAYGTCNDMPEDSDFFTSVCADTGNVVLKVSVSADGSEGGIWTVDEGYTRYFDETLFGDDGNTESGHAEVDDAEGVTFFFAVNCFWGGGY